MTTYDQAPAAPEQDPAPTIDTEKLMAFVFRAVDEVGAALNAALVVMGDQLGYYRALAEQGPLTASELARISSTGEKYAREWLNAQAAGDLLVPAPWRSPPEEPNAAEPMAQPVGGVPVS